MADNNKKKIKDLDRYALTSNWEDVKQFCNSRREALVEIIYKETGKIVKDRTKYSEQDKRKRHKELFEKIAKMIDDSEGGILMKEHLLEQAESITEYIIYQVQDSKTGTLMDIPMYSGLDMKRLEVTNLKAISEKLIDTVKNRYQEVETREIDDESVYDVDKMINS